MHAASRYALAQLSASLDEDLRGEDQAIAAAAQIGTELFDVVEVLDEERRLRTSVADVSLSADQRAGLIAAVFADKVSLSTLKLLRAAAAKEWSTPREFRAGLVQLGRRAILRSADLQGQLLQVEDELFRLSRLLLKQPQLALRLDDRSADSLKRRELFAHILYGKVTAATETLALQVVGRREANIIDDLHEISTYAASMWGREVAYVESAVELSESQKQALSSKLERIYGRAMSIHLEVNPSLLGGMIIRVDDEVIDGSYTGKIDRLRLLQV
ncbi:F0F1 ATP synthase subunit delta [Corynebacterium sp. ES2794-CONJ1]|uniref:F0F1 ATP synthase subunit delta n=1 Tax=unclassified Corynebacterium TaxID=2624378 RepID=UPI00216AADFA|nr:MULTISPECIES: F0F1 ATP synthase subunit delta [unclassified Corynebacterium]MCS4489822.1 F0F1 ATP synthase subunit delta [Corynebacterium sp. ES2775-CONJ]MCS4491814.1 F0F1 ATP synthase subunit delta [Corynebacterium sp. ES2715-CONJ3]MCS4531919.1 F0F1 ATP synthase subunit delta [Corynebacterium sp. ES2730-CONJ]MCU9519320.1 F0F1 ATP synthase subunit delta [Corynebacterium sp. ES2794-CONJ1]